jgi:uncharacterized metal-binding protein
MPNDNIHNLVAIALLGLCLYFMSVWKFKPNFIATFSGFYLFSLFWLSPDLDLDRGSGSLRRWGPLKFIWYPYKEIFHHRGISHDILIGPLTRLLYFGLIIWALVSGLRLSLELPPLQGEFPSAILAGLWLPDVLHCLLDRMTTEWKS